MGLAAKICSKIAKSTVQKSCEQDASKNSKKNFFIFYFLSNYIPLMSVAFCFKAALIRPDVLSAAASSLSARAFFSAVARVTFLSKNVSTKAENCVASFSVIFVASSALIFSHASLADFSSVIVFRSSVSSLNSTFEGSPPVAGCVFIAPFSSTFRAVRMLSYLFSKPGLSSMISAISRASFAAAMRFAMLPRVAAVRAVDFDPGVPPSRPWSLALAPKIF